MTEPTIVCPQCRNEIRLTESLAAPLVAATRREFEQRLSEKDAEIVIREHGVREKERAVLDAKRAIDGQVADQVAAQVKLERTRVVAEESAKAKLASAAEMDAARRRGSVGRCIGNDAGLFVLMKGNAGARTLGLTVYR